MRDTWVDRLFADLAPQYYLSRVKARGAADLLRRNFDAAAVGRRTQGWRRTTGDANAASGPSLARLREVARDLVRNNPYAESAVSTIADHAVGWGIVATAASDSWRAWADSTAVDADGRHDLVGLQKLVMRTVVESGEVLVRRRIRRLEDGLPIPLQLQVLEPDFLDTSRDAILPTGGRIVQGVEFDPLGRRAAYWLFREHPGASLLRSGTLFPASSRIPAADVAHIFRSSRPGQVRGPSWFAPVLLRFKDFDEYEDAQLMKQKIAACLAVITSDTDGEASRLGAAAADDATIDTLAPGMILNVPPGRSVDVVQPPTVGDYKDFSEITLRAIATGLGVTYEDLTGDYTDLPFSAARMSRIRHWARVEDWRWRMLIPQFLGPVWAWAAEASAIQGTQLPATTEWTAPGMPMVEPDKEGLAIQRNVRAGIMTHSEAIRERGYVPERFLEELAKDFAALDAKGLILDLDPRKMTQAGQRHSATAAAEEPETPKADEEATSKPAPKRKRP